MLTRPPLDMLATAENLGACKGTQLVEQPKIMLGGKDILDMLYDEVSGTLVVYLPCEKKFTVGGFLTLEDVYNSDKTGPDGPAGPDGLAGKDGLNGADGDTGPVGPTGCPGEPGRNGKSYTDAKFGNVGDAGAAGAPGQQGAQGPAGVGGPTGPAGPPGPPGPPGTNGIDAKATTYSGEPGRDGIVLVSVECADPAPTQPLMQAGWLWVSGDCSGVVTTCGHVLNKAYTLGGTPPNCTNHELTVDLGAAFVGKNVRVTATFRLTDGDVNCSGYCMYGSASASGSLVNANSVVVLDLQYAGGCVTVGYSCVVFSPSLGKCVNGTCTVTAVAI